MIQAEDPVHEDSGKWFFWIETWAERCGPYDSETEARLKFKQYCEEVLL